MRIQSFAEIPSEHLPTKLFIDKAKFSITEVLEDKDLHSSHYTILNRGLAERYITTRWTPRRRGVRRVRRAGAEADASACRRRRSCPSVAPCAQLHGTAAARGRSPGCCDGSGTCAGSWRWSPRSTSPAGFPTASGS